MAEIFNKKLVDLAGLSVFWGKTKDYVDGKIVDINNVIEENEKTAAAALNDLNSRVTTNADAISSIQDELNSLSGGAGSIATQIDNAIAKLDLPNTYDAKGAAATAKSEAITASAVTITEAAGSGDILKSYTFKQGENTIGTINLAKDLVVTGGSVVEKDGVKYLQLSIANQDAPVEIAVKDLVDVYTGGDYVTIGTDNVITVDKAGIIEGLAVANDVYSKTDADNKFVAKVTGERLMTDAEGTKLVGIAEGAQVNVIESVVVNGVTATIADKVASVTVDCYTKTEIDTKLTDTLDAAKTYTDEALGVFGKTSADGAILVPATGLRMEIEDRDAAVLSSAKAYTDELGKIVKGVYDAGQLVTNGHEQRIVALEEGLNTISIATSEEIIGICD